VDKEKIVGGEGGTSEIKYKNKNEKGVVRFMGKLRVVMEKNGKRGNGAPLQRKH